MNKEKLDQLIGRKQKEMGADLQIILPGEMISPDIAADWMIQLLNRMYFRHGVANNAKGLVEAIEKGDCRPWFVLKKGEPVACAALVRNRDGSVEIGRAVSFEKGLGSLLMLKAALELVDGISEPLVAEVRISDSFWGIPSSLPTQVVCFSHLGLMPHAVLPAFGHGKPFRQEMFVLAASSIEKNGGVSLPDNPTIAAKIGTAAKVAGFGEARTKKGERVGGGWEIVVDTPFAIIGPSRRGVSLATVLQEVDQRANFCLLPIELTPENFGRMELVMNAGFIPCGFDRTLGKSGEPILLMGLLKHGVPLAPIRLMSGILDEEVMMAIRKINNQFRI